MCNSNCEECEKLFSPKTEIRDEVVYNNDSYCKCKDRKCPFYL